MASSHCGLAGTGRAFRRLQLLLRVRVGEEVGHARSFLQVSRRSYRIQDDRRRVRNAHKGCYAPFSPRARTRPPQRRAATAGPPPAPPEPSPDVPVPVPPAVLEHHLQAAQRIDQPTAAAAAAAALVAAPRRHPRRRQPPTAAPRRPRRCSPASRPPTAAPERPSAAAAAARTGRRGRTAAGDDAPAVGSGVGHRPSTWRQDPGFVGFRSAGHAPRR